MGGLTHINPVVKLNDLYTNLGHTYLDPEDFDILDIHYYENDVPPDLTNKMNAFATERDKNMDGAKEIWVTEISASNRIVDYTQNPPKTVIDPNRQTTYLRNVFNQLDTKYLENRNVKKVFWWTSRGYFFNTDKPEEGGEHALFENNFYPRPVYFDFGEWLGTITKKGEVPALSVSGGKITVKVPASMLNERGEYSVFYASPSRLVTALPLTIQVTAEKTPTPVPTRTPTTTPLPADLNHDGIITIVDFTLLVSDVSKTGAPAFIPADIDKNGNVNIFDFNQLVGNFGK